MSIRYAITSYCSHCGIDFLESDSDDLDDLVATIETQSDYHYMKHKKHNECN